MPKPIVGHDPERVRILAIYFFEITFNIVRFEFLATVTSKITVFWDLTPCSLVDVYQNFAGTCCNHFQGERVIRTWKSSWDKLRGTAEFEP
jgi:hypothetical protein